jgi:hypothetical protein
MRAVLIAVAVAALAGAAHAETAATEALNTAVRRAEQPAAGVRLAPADAEAYALKRAGIARTAIERKADDATLSAGFLCGLKETADRSGGASARGSDPHGRFLGAKLSFAFR